MKIVLDTTILVRANEHAHGVARDLVISLVDSQHTILLSNEMLYELARVLRYPRLTKFYNLTENLVYNYVDFLRESAEMVQLNPIVNLPIRDVNDVIVMQTALVGEADVLCTRDEDFFQEPASGYLKRAGIAVLDDIAVMRLLRG